MRKAMLTSLAKALMKAPVYVYRYTFKPFVGQNCRHWPTCSDYALQAIDKNGAWRGFWLMVSRIARCGPGGTHGVDPVPDIRAERRAFAPWLYGRWRSVNAGDRDDGRRHLDETVVKAMPSPDGARRVLIVQRPNGLYGFEEEYFSDEPREQCWLRGGQYPFSLCDTPQTAEREARGRIDWLKDVP